MLTYRQAHTIVWGAKGRAGDYPCINCGDDARCWAYQHGDPGELVDEKGRPYSPNPDSYEPMCQKCHRNYDLEHDARVREAARNRGQEWGRSRTRRLGEDEDFRRKVSETSRAAMAIRRQCSECGLVSHPAGIGRHFKYSGHAGYIQLEGSNA